MKQRRISRRSFLTGSCALLAGAVTAACARPAEPTTAPTAKPVATAVPATAAPTAKPAATTAPPIQATAAPTQPVTLTYKEAPELKALVDQGKLPPVAKRLPDSPMVVRPVKEVGQYGGNWRMGLLGGADSASLSRTIYYEPLVRWTPDWSGWIPNIAEAFQANADASEWTIKLRKGLKWSDGQPFTAEDIVFWYEDVIKNKELTSKPPAYMVVGGKEGEVVRVDDLTVKVKFAGPSGFFPLQVASPTAWGFGLSPKHYLKQFHAKYNADVAKLAKDAGFATWVDYFNNRADKRQNPEVPVLDPWRLTAPYGSGAQVLTAKRNPFYFKVDPEGHQLPYIDQVTFSTFEKVDLMVLQALNGEIDMQARHIGTLANKSVLLDGRQKGNYRLFSTKSTYGNSCCFFPNHLHPDPVMREILTNKDFRIGLSYAINRQEVIDAVFAGQAEPRQHAPLPGPLYDEQAAKQYTEYSVEKANAYLDKVVPQKDSAGFRLRPDGKRLTLVVDVASSMADHVAVSELVVDYWKKVGIDAILQVQDRSIMYERFQGAQHDVTVWAAGGGGGLEVLINVNYYFPFAADNRVGAPWGVWYLRGGKEGQEPPAHVKKIQETYDQVKVQPTFEKQVEKMREVVRLYAEWFPHIGISTQPDLFGIVKNNMHNVPESMIDSWTYPTPAPTNPEQYFFR